jgi:hypothetical protein
VSRLRHGQSPEQMRENIAEMTWNLHRTFVGAWVVFSSTEIFTSTHRKRVENWIVLHGAVRQDELERLFRDADEKGEGVITVSLFHGPDEGS